jgi:hypothetical protein
MVMAGVVGLRFWVVVLRVVSTHPMELQVGLMEVALVVAHLLVQTKPEQ